MSTSAEIVVVGGGIAGLSFAAALAGRASVVVLEAEDALFHHTSSRSAQQMQPTYGPEPVRRLTGASIPLVSAIAERLGAPIFTPRPLLWLDYDEDPAGFEHLLATVPGLERIDPDEAVRLLPALHRAPLTGAGIDGSAVEVDVPVLLAAYRAAAEAAGAVIETGARVERAERVGDVWRLIAGSRTIEAPVVVDAAGAWTDRVAALLGGTPRGLVPKRRTVAVAPATARPVDPSWPMAADAADTFYFRSRGAEILACALEDTPSEPEDARPLPEVVAEAIRRVDAVTDLALGAPSSAWTGLRTVSPDGLPVVGSDAAVPGLYWLGGQGGFGIQTSAALSTIAAADVLGADHALELDGVLDAFSPARPSLR